MKDFDNWNEKKKNIEELEIVDFYPKGREIWWCSLGVNLGVEADGKEENFRRPVLILKAFNKEMSWILPLTSSNRENPFYHELVWGGQKSWLILSQIRTVSNKRLERKVGFAELEDFNKVKEKIISLIKEGRFELS